MRQVVYLDYAELPVYRTARKGKPTFNLVYCRRALRRSHGHHHLSHGFHLFSSELTKRFDRHDLLRFPNAMSSWKKRWEENQRFAKNPQPLEASKLPQSA